MTTGREPNVTQLRDRIDRGRTGEKVPAADPAAAPLGTDDEAAGTGSDRGVDPAAEHRRETTGIDVASNRPPIAADSGDLRDDAGRRRPGYVWIGVVGVSCAVALAIAVAAMS